jgi:TRAP-type C4-dicarboxylate transport system permease small subunit
LIDRSLDGLCRLFDGLCALLMLGMVVLVFGNVVLRYAFNSGISIAEELSRWMFVWITFLGAVSAMRARGHLGTDMVVGLLSRRGKQACLVISQLIMLAILWLLFDGSLAQVRINADVAAPTSGLPMAVVYASGLVFAVCAGAMLLVDLVRCLSGRLDERDLVQVLESEDLAAPVRQ